MDPHEEALQGAIRDLELGVFTSQRAAAKAWAVPRTSIQRRLQGSVPHAIAHQQQQRLTPEQESFIVILLKPAILIKIQPELFISWKKAALFY